VRKHLFFIEETVMEKISLGKSALGYPMPVVLVGVAGENRPNFMTAAWVTCANYQPPMFLMALGKSHYTSQWIRKNRAFSINIPGKNLLEKTDWCGLVSGKDIDKSEKFGIFYGKLETVPMIRECPLCFECTLVETVALPADELYIGEIAETWSEQRYLSDGKPDTEKIEPFILTMPDNRYWSLGESLGKAWSSGRHLINRK
jgi:flavin reductase (DIM6/NTAB) family NADH-FMN oxidoreductase RutF